MHFLKTTLNAYINLFQVLEFRINSYLIILIDCFANLRTFYSCEDVTLCLIL